VYRASPGAPHGDDRMTKRPRVVSSNPVTWDTYRAAKWLGSVEGASAQEAVEAAAKEFKIDARQLIAVRRS